MSKLTRGQQRRRGDVVSLITGVDGSVGSSSLALAALLSVSSVGEILPVVVSGDELDVMTFRPKNSVNSGLE